MITPRTEDWAGLHWEVHSYVPRSASKPFLVVGARVSV